MCIKKSDQKMLYNILGQKGKVVLKYLGESEGSLGENCYKNEYRY